MKKPYEILASTELAIALFLVISLAAIPGTFSKSREIYANPLFLALLGLLGLNLVLCTVRRRRSISRPVLVLHCGVLLTLAGCVVSSRGFVATVNVYEGSAVDKVYRWDRKADMPLGMDLTVKAIHHEYYPVPVKVGVLKGREKFGLFTLSTGGSFRLAEFTVKVENLDLQSRSVRLGVYRQGIPVGSADTSGVKSLPADFPYDFKLVAFQNPALKRLWVDLALARGGRTLAEGSSEVNNPFVWEGLYFYNTQVDRDAAGLPYAGIQIVKDPGRNFAFAGMAVVALGALAAFFRRFYGYK